ncbi:MarR family winged helix-turn-helix transcriptional regulator [Ectobacillus ponti]|uniref:MarR family winged helix-turn-helix transcriptional regulator n=1 Tax=Ectobacillus ponti TaxID=2961894 RepID=A0AA41X863_9BACI|nr:MarR family winged helix-turn-helix transcriptional regulator [Ectobacillus ponti]MCP8970671.1 MarR family winged helix-turn-helix transcriptional regulator [Ectobacillus ponti]
MDKTALFFQCLSFTSSVHRVTHELTQPAKPASITQVQYDMLMHIAVNQPVTVSELSDCQHMSLPNTSRELRKLSEKSLIEKVSDEEDKRRQHIRLSNEGQALMNEVLMHMQAGFQERLRQTSEEDVEEISRALGMLQTKMFY